MSNYFSYFPNVSYDIQKNNQPRSVVDIMRRFSLKIDLRDRSTVFYNYTIQDGDRPDIIASKYYGDSKYDWIVMLPNNIFDVDFDWPMDTTKFEKYIISKFGSLASAHQQVHSYEKIIRSSSYDNLGKYIKEKTIKVDEQTYNGLAGSARKSISQYDHELAMNEAKRNIRLIDSKFLGQMIEAAEEVFE